MQFDIEVPVYAVVRVTAEDEPSAITAAEALVKDLAQMPPSSISLPFPGLDSTKVEEFSLALLSEDEDRTPDVYPI